MPANGRTYPRPSCLENTMSDNGKGVNVKGFSFEMLSNISILSNMYDYVYELSRIYVRIKRN